MSDLGKVLADRQATHGDFRDVSRVAQETKDVWRGSRNWSELPHFMREGLEMVAHKVARILSGDSHHVDHWDDLADYPTRVVGYLKASPSRSPVPQEQRDERVALTIVVELTYQKSSAERMLKSGPWFVVDISEGSDYRAEMTFQRAYPTESIR